VERIRTPSQPLDVVVHAQQVIEVDREHDELGNVELAQYSTDGLDQLVLVLDESHVFLHAHLLRVRHLLFDVVVVCLFTKGV
jgi:hypothetical protein